jgi:POT family proton-dependent oligopeptide transporter
VNEKFVSYINEKAGGTNYFVNKLQIEEKKVKAEKIKNEDLRKERLEESFITFLDKNNNYIDNGTVKVVSKEKADEILASSTSASVISCLRQDSLSLGLRVFRMLGLFAIGAGVVLFLGGPIISRWMHGIK